MNISIEIYRSSHSNLSYHSIECINSYSIIIQIAWFPLGSFEESFLGPWKCEFGADNLQNSPVKLVVKSCTRESQYEISSFTESVAFQ